MPGSGIGLGFGVNPLGLPDLWDPAEVANLVLWVRAEELAPIGSGNPISTWPDKSGNGNDLLGLTTTRPTVATGQRNGKAAALFDGNDDYLAVTGIGFLAQPNHIFIVYKPSSDGVLFDSKNTSDRHVGTHGTNVSGRADSYAGSTLPGPTGLSLDWHVGEFLFNGASSTVVIDAAGPGTGDAGAQGMVNVTLGNEWDFGAASPMDGYISEFLVYSAEVTGGDLTNLRTFLA